MVILVLHLLTCKRLGVHRGPQVDPDDTNEALARERKWLKMLPMSNVRLGGTERDHVYKTSGGGGLRAAEEGKGRDERP